MEVKDTVIKDILAIHGYTVEEAEGILNNAGRAIYQAGIKEVVESLRDLWTDGAITFLDSGAFKGKKLWAVPYELWQAKLKEWGIK